MLVLSRKPQESIVIDGNIRITVLKVNRNTVSIGIEAPREVSIRRGELPHRRTPLLTANEETLKGSGNQSSFTEEGALI